MTRRKFGAIACLALTLLLLVAGCKKQETLPLSLIHIYLLNYNLGAAPEDPPFLTLTYRLKDGRTVEVAASATTVCLLYTSRCV